MLKYLSASSDVRKVLDLEIYLNNYQQFWVLWKLIVSKHGYINPNTIRTMKKEDVNMLINL